MVAYSPGESRSLIEMGIGWVAKSAAKRKTRNGPGAVTRVWWFLTEILGTMLSLAGFIIGGFLLAPFAGWMMLGVAFLVLDFKLGVTRHARRGER